jgi:hypothetical protein
MEAGESLDSRAVFSRDALFEHSLSRDVIDLEPDAIRILEQYRVVSGHPSGLLGRMNDAGSEPDHKRMDRVDILAVSRPKTYVMQSAPALIEPVPGRVIGGRPETHRGAPSDEVEVDFRIHNLRETQMQQECTVKRS